MSTSEAATMSACGIETFIVSRHDEWYQAWPDIARTASGRLVCVFSQCRHHGDRSFARFVWVTSDDGGATWSEPRPLCENTEEGHWNCPRITALADGRLVAVGDHVVRGERSGDRDLTNWLWISDDEGESWSEPIATPIYGIVPDKLLVMDDGRWVIAAQRHSPEHKYLEQRVWWSDDQGSTWQGPATVASRAGLNLCEASVLPLGGRGLVAFMRENSGQGWDAFKSFSGDGGESWDGPYPTVLDGCHRPVSGWLASGLCLVTYRYIQGGRGGWGRGTQNFFGALLSRRSVESPDRNQQWARIRPLDFDRHAQSDLGYSGWVQLPDGEILVVTYLLDDWPRGQIRGYRLREEDFGDRSLLLEE